jgi:serine/threonine protein kinase/regulator of sirC expression with transglutaminase-like and TPR domain
MTTAFSPRTGEPPESFGRYRILKKLGQGGMGTVYLAHDPELSRLIALKIPLDEAGPEAAERFLRAARAAASLQHPNICPIYEAGAIDGAAYLTMAYIDGHTLAERLRSGRPSVGEATRLVRAVALALAEAHDGGVLHRDVKPANILINRRGEPILTDFGLARLGTPAYMAPEEVRDEPAGDVYSLGVVLYESLTGRLPFNEMPSEIDPRLESICQRAMATNVADRYPNMTAFAAALAPFAETAPAERNDENWSLSLSAGDAVIPSSDENKPAARRSRWPWRLVAASAVGLAAVFAGVYAFTQMQYLQRVPKPPAITAPAYQATVDVNPNNTAAWLLSAQGWHAQGRRDKELSTFREAWNAVTPTTADDYTGLAQIALGLDRLEDALGAADEAVKRDPHLADAFEARARVWLRKGDKDRAAADYARAADLMKPREAHDFLDRSILYELAGNSDKALADADRALELAPRLAAAFRQRGSVYRGKKDRAHAVADYRRALAVLPPRSAADYFDRGWLYNELGDYDHAVADLEQALSLGLRSGEVHGELAHAYRNHKDYDKAAPHLDEALRLLPADALLYGERGALSFARGRYGNAIKDYTETLMLNPGDAQTYVNRGDAYFQSGDNDRAVEDYSRALRKMPGIDRSALADVYDRRGVAWARLKKYAEATADYDRAIDNDPDDPVLYLNRAVARKQTGDGAGADADVRRAEELRGAP